MYKKGLLTILEPDLFLGSFSQIFAEYMSGFRGLWSPQNGLKLLHDGQSMV